MTAACIAFSLFFLTTIDSAELSHVLNIFTDIEFGSNPITQSDFVVYASGFIFLVSIFLSWSLYLSQASSTPVANHVISRICLTKQSLPELTKVSVLKYLLTLHSHVFFLSHGVPSDSSGPLFSLNIITFWCVAYFFVWSGHQHVNTLPDNLKDSEMASLLCAHSVSTNILVQDYAV